MGKWRFECPTGGVYEGECRYRKEGEAFILECREGVRTVREGCLELSSKLEEAFKSGNPDHNSMFEALERAYEWAEKYTGLSARDMNEVWTPEIIGTVVGDIMYDSLFGKIGSALMNLITGGLIVAGASVAKDRLSKEDLKMANEIGAHFVTRVGRIASPGEFSFALREANVMGRSFALKDIEGALRQLVKTPERLSFDVNEVKRAMEDLRRITALPAPAPAPAPAAPPAVPAAPAPVAEVM